MKKVLFFCTVFVGSLFAEQPVKTADVMNEQKQLNYFTEPGIITYSNGWIGSYRLSNLPKNIYLIVERVRTKGTNWVVDKDVVQKNVEEILKAGGFNVINLSGNAQIPLPLFHVLITSVPIPDGKVVDIDVRLFEKAKLAREKTPEGISLQAMTWENESFIEETNEDVSKKVLETVNRLVNDFVAQYKREENFQRQYQ